MPWNNNIWMPRNNNGNNSHWMPWNNNGNNWIPWKYNSRWMPWKNNNGFNTNSWNMPWNSSNSYPAYQSVLPLAIPMIPITTPIIKYK